MTQDKVQTDETALKEKQKIDSVIDNTKLSLWIIHGGSVLWVPVLALTGFGILFVYSASSVYSAQHYANEFYFVKKQILFLIPSIIAAIIGVKFPLELFYKYIRIIFVGLIFLTFATHLPHIGRRVSGAARWINMGPFPLQPSEFLKIFAILFMVWIVSLRKKDPVQKFSPVVLEKKVYFDYLLLALAPIGIIAQKDLGTTLVVIIGFLSILFINGLPKRFFAVMFAFLSAGLLTAIIAEPYRISRVMTFINPFKDPLGAGFQVIQSFVAIANGGLVGRGIGESQQKLFFLPEAHTDFILAVITEEMGFIGVLVLAILYCILYYAVLRLIIYARSESDRLLATGCFAMLVFTTTINMGVVAGAFPTKGLPLPFISNGGSALIANYFIIGLMSQISKRIYSK